MRAVPGSEDNFTLDLHRTDRSPEAITGQVLITLKNYTSREAELADMTPGCAHAAISGCRGWQQLRRRGVASNAQLRMYTAGVEIKPPGAHGTGKLM